MQCAAGFYIHPLHCSESLDLRSSQRRWKVLLMPETPRMAEPFHVSASVRFGWSPFQAARSYTCEEDLLTELFGEKKLPRWTEERLVRVDLDLRAALPYGSATPLPEGQELGAWCKSTEEKLDGVFDDPGANGFNPPPLKFPWLARQILAAERAPGRAEGTDHCPCRRNQTGVPIHSPRSTAGTLSSQLSSSWRVVLGPVRDSRAEPADPGRSPCVAPGRRPSLA